MHDNVVRLGNLRDLLEPISERSTFKVEGRNQSREDYRDFAARDIRYWPRWKDGLIADVHIPEDLLISLCRFIRADLGEYVDQATDRIGHAFPIGGSPKDQGVRFLEGGGVGFSSTSQVENFAKSLAGAAYVLGAQRVVEAIGIWVKGEPINCCVKSILNTPGTLPGKHSPTPGVYIESLPLSTDHFTGYFPLLGERSPANYLGRAVLTIEYATAPVFFRPGGDRPEREVWVTNPIGAGPETICQALALEANNFVGIANSWLDFAENSSFRLGGRESTWSPPRASRSRPWSNYTLYFDRGVTTLELHDASELQISGQRLARSLAVLSDHSSRNLRTAASRWLRSKDSSDTLSDRFIDLRIAIESLYLHDFVDEQSGELSFRSALFGAWHLGSDFEERKRIRKTLRDAYSKASRVVHTGELAKPRAKRTHQRAENQRRKDSKLLSEAQDVIRRGLLAVIVDGQPQNWGDIVLGGGPAGQAHFARGPNA